MTSRTQDDGFHEIQLNGKQLVFLFMAATVVSVVIFLCGVLVGRGVRAERALDSNGSAPSAEAVTTPQQTAAAPAPAAGSDPTTAAPPPSPPADDLSYCNRLEKQKAPAEQLKPAPEPEKVASAARAAPPPPAATAAPEPAPASAEPAEPGGPGYVVQIAALNERREAEAIAKRLSSKGYSAYVL